MESPRVPGRCFWGCPISYEPCRVPLKRNYRVPFKGSGLIYGMFKVVVMMRSGF